MASFADWSPTIAGSSVGTIFSRISIQAAVPPSDTACCRFFRERSTNWFSLT